MCVDADYEEYLGVPYAAPPVGGNRWRKPVSPQPWRDVRDVTAFGASCFQFAGNDTDYSAYSEDCLFLNVYVPGQTAAR